MTDNNKHLVRVGHEFAAAMSDDTPIITIAKMVTELASALDVQSARSDALVAKLNDVCAENEELKRANSVALNILNDEDTMITSLWASSVHKVVAETPSTDAWVNEQRAAVWINGNEPEEFGRYWVRYESEVGPQYCSARWLEHNFCAGSDINIHKIWLADHSRSINQLRGVTHYTKLPPELEAAQLRGSQV
ncbi:hypothetical protein [Atlantibacter subterraneus]|uniref:hypothetical protein n=1 Tax=Atlantibacter subterraneus TaxID=255519 RepID=UPI0028AF02A5|nr:hypothetical protein [Atlantibacter subterranea]